MSFSAQWLALRERYDIAARNAQVLAAVAGAFSDRRSIAVVDLASGTGSTRRAICAHLPARQQWKLADNDLSLLARAVPDDLPPDVQVSAVPLDLAHDLEAMLDGAVELVTASALLDLVSGEWLQRFAIEAAVRNLPVYAALTFDGRVSFDPDIALDAKVVAAVNEHQLTDKGFGPALGPLAAKEAITRFERLGYRVTRGHSDWVLAAQDRDIQYELLDGWAAAASSLKQIDTVSLAQWLAARRALVSQGRSSMRVGHVDFFAQPSTRR